MIVAEECDTGLRACPRSHLAKRLHYGSPNPDLLGRGLTLGQAEDDRGGITALAFEIFLPKHMTRIGAEYCKQIVRAVAEIVLAETVACAKREMFVDENNESSVLGDPDGFGDGLRDVIAIGDDECAIDSMQAIVRKFQIVHIHQADGR